MKLGIMASTISGIVLARTGYDLPPEGSGVYLLRVAGPNPEVDLIVEVTVKGSDLPERVSELARRVADLEWKAEGHIKARGSNDEPDTT